MKQGYMTNNEQKNKLVETDQEIVDKRNKLAREYKIYTKNKTKQTQNKTEGGMNNMRTMKDIKIYIELIYMKVTLYGINTILGTAEENTVNLKTSRKIIQNKTRVKTLKNIEYELAMENIRFTQCVQLKTRRIGGRQK